MSFAALHLNNKMPITGNGKEARQYSHTVLSNPVQMLKRFFRLNTSGWTSEHYSHESYRLLPVKRIPGTNRQYMFFGLQNMSSIAMDLICRMHLHDQFVRYDAINNNMRYHAIDAWLLSIFIHTVHRRSASRLCAFGHTSSHLGTVFLGKAGSHRALDCQRSREAQRLSFQLATCSTSWI